MTHEDEVLIDACLEAGAKLETHGPGIVIRREDLGIPLLTLRHPQAWCRPHLKLRGTYEGDYGCDATGAIRGALCNHWPPDLPLVYVDPYSFEELSD